MRTIHRDIVGAFIFSSDYKVLLGQSVKGGVYTDLWIVPGGGIEPDESHDDALLREVREETGLDISKAIIRKLAKVSFGSSEKVLQDTGERVLVEMKFYDYEVILAKPSLEVEVHGLDDFSNAAWFNAKQVADLQLGPATEATLSTLNFLA